jgi:hypothetical protein
LECRFCADLKTPPTTLEKPIAIHHRGSGKMPLASSPGLPAPEIIRAWRLLAARLLNL